MKDERATEILRAVFYANFGYMPDCEKSEDAFYVGRMVGIMQKTLEIELEKEIEVGENE